MKAGWQVRKFGEVCELKKGKKPSLSSAPANGYMPYLVAKCLRGAEPVEFASISDRNSIPISQHEIIIICDGSNSGETFIGFDGILSSTMAKIAHGAELDNKFLMYFLDSLFEQFNSSKTGSAIPHLDLAALRGLNLPVPPLPEQQRIVGILDAAFDGIATAKANAEQNLQNARALFESHLQSVLTQSSAEWGDRQLISLCSIFADSAHRTPKYQDEGIPALRPRDVINGKLNLSSAARVSEQEYEIQSKRYKPNSGDIVYSRELSYGWAALLPESPRICLSQGMCIFRPSSDIETAYLLFVLNGAVGREQAMRAAVGAAHPHINLGDIKSYVIPFPPIDEQRKITHQFEKLQYETQRLESIYQRKLAALDELKQSLLHHAFSGML